MKLRVSAKLFGIVAVFFAALVAQIAITLVMDYQKMLQQTETELRNIGETAATAAKPFSDRVASGELTLDQGREEYFKLLSGMRFSSGKEYFVAEGEDGTMLMHPFVKALIGTNVLDQKDIDGNYINRGILGSVGGNAPPVRYMWPRPDTKVQTPKMAVGVRVEGLKTVLSVGTFLDERFAQYWHRAELIIGVGVVAVLAIVGLAVALALNITRPLGRMVGEIQQLSRGQYGFTVADADRGDEFGEVARAIDELRGTVSEAERLRQAQVEAQQKAVEAEKRMLLQLAQSLDSDVGAAVKQASSAVDDLGRRVDEMGELARKTSASSDTVSRNAASASTNVGSVAAASEELSSTSSEIARQVKAADDMAQEAVSISEQSRSAVGALAEASNRIGQVVELIDSIASQTNLLALNATIEAARAGEAGRGFAVVANEVKNLAGQTSRATEEITTQIESMRGLSDQAVTAIERIGAAISRVGEATTAIAAATEEQDAAIREISGNVQLAAGGTNAISESIGEVAQAASSTLSVSSAVEETMRTMSSAAEKVSSVVRTIVDKLRQQAA